MPLDPAHWRRFDRPELDVVWCGIEALDIADKFVLLRELASEIAAAGLKKGTEYERVAAAVVSLRTAYDELGHSPTVPEYRELRKSRPDLRLVSDGSIRRWLGNGSWDDCLRRALLEVVSDGDFVTLGEGDAFSEHELVDAVLAYMAEHEDRVPVYSHYVAWARSPEVRRRPGRRPLSNGPFDRFGGYRAVLQRNALTGADRPRFDIRGRVLPLQWKYSDGEYVDAILRVKARIGRWPRQAEYKSARDDLRDEGIFVPSASALTNHFGGGWSHVLEGAGGPAVDSTSKRASYRGRDTSPYTREELVAALTEAWIEVGEPFTKKAYDAWRARQLAARAEAHEPLRLPTADRIAREFGGWPEALDVALPPDVQKRRRRKTYE